MPKTPRFYCTLFIGISLIALAGCNKLFDYIKDHPDEDCTDCQITKLVCSGHSNGTFIADVVYNSWGDPVSVTPNRIGTGNPQRLFRYDSKHRLTDYLGAYENGYYEQWQRFVYDNNNRIIRDTTYAFGLLNDRTNALLGPGVTTYGYDAKGRVIHTLTIDLQHPEYTQEFNYVYDANGNKVIEGREYDNKINFRRTNKVWMFIDKNYSVNNLKPASGYNDKGLPKNLYDVNLVYSGFLQFYGDTLTLTYKCK